MLAAWVRRFGVAVVVAALAWPGRAAADAWPTDDTAYRELIRKALQEYQLGNWAEAKLYFSDAHALYPNARTLRGLGLVAYALRDYVDAIGYLESAQINPTQPLTPELRAQIAKLLGQARRFVARVVVTLEPPDAELRVDEQPPARTPDGAVWLNPGTHELSAMREGYASTMRRVSAEAGTSIAVRLTLQREAPEQPAQLPAPARSLPAEASPVVPQRGAGKASSIAPYVVIGLSTAVAATGGVLLGVALNDISELERPRPNTEWASVERTYRNTAPLSAAGIALIGVGAAGIGAGLLWALWPDGGREDVAVRPSATGLVLQGRL